MNKACMIILAAVTVAACGRTTPEQQILNDVAEALGGKARLQQIKTLTIEGEGEAPNLGQNITTDSPLPVWKVSGYRRAVGVGNDRMRVKQVRTAQFLFAGANVQRLDQGIDGEFGYNVGQDGAVTRTATLASDEFRTNGI